ncbi:MAG: hypothetical protein WAW42_17355 [Candidatus Competibacteraceae bacterium]
MITYQSGLAGFEKLIIIKYFQCGAGIRFIRHFPALVAANGGKLVIVQPVPTPAISKNKQRRLPTVRGSSVNTEVPPSEACLEVIDVPTDQCPSARGSRM